MAAGTRGAVVQQIQRLFQIGSATGLSEWELLRRYLALRDESAFEAIVARHGPMVLGVCRRILHDPRDVEDAFQATFLVLVRRARALGERDAIGPWLYGVAYRVSLRARAVGLKRNDRETLDPDLNPPAPDIDPTLFELNTVIDGELSRLPAKYRAPVVLCYLEGRTHEEAARRLGWPVGSVKGRLARARELLKTRLTRRGVALSAATLMASLSRELHAGVPDVLCESTVRAAIRFTTQPAVGVISATVAALTEGVLRTMSMTKISVAAVSVLVTTGALVWATQAADSEAKPQVAGAATPPTSGGHEVPREASVTIGTDPLRPGGMADLAERRASVAHEAWVFAREKYERGELSVTRLAEASRHYAEVQADTSERREDKLSAINAHWIRMVEIEKRATSKPAREHASDGNETAIQEARVARIEAEWWLAKAEAEGGPKDQAKPAEANAFLEQRLAFAKQLSPSEKSRAILLALEKSHPMASAKTLEELLKRIKVLSKSHELPDGIAIFVDPVGLEEAKRRMDAQLHLVRQGGPLSNQLATGLQGLGMAYTVRDGLLIVSSRSQIAFMELESLRDEVRALREQIRAGDAARAAVPFPDTQVITNSEAELWRSLAEKRIHRARATGVLPEQDEEEQTEAILAALNKVVPIHAQNTSIEDFVNLIKQSTVSQALPKGVPVYLDRAALATQGNPKVTIDLDGARLKTTLRLALGQVGLSYTVKEGLLMILDSSSPELQGGRLYPNSGMGGGMGMM